MNGNNARRKVRILATVAALEALLIFVGAFFMARVVPVYLARDRVILASDSPDGRARVTIISRPSGPELFPIFEPGVKPIAIVESPTLRGRLEIVLEYRDITDDVRDAAQTATWEGDVCIIRPGFGEPIRIGTTAECNKRHED